LLVKVSPSVEKILSGLLFLLAAVVAKEDLADNLIYLITIIWLVAFFKSKKVQTGPNLISGAIMIFFFLYSVSFCFNLPRASPEEIQLRTLCGLFTPFIFYMIISTFDNVTEAKIETFLNVFWISLTLIVIWSIITQCGNGFSVEHRLELFKRHPNISAAPIALAVLALALQLVREKKPWKIGLELGSLLICLAGLACTLSRGMWLAVLGSGGWLTCVVFKKVPVKRLALILAVFLAVAALLTIFMPQFGERAQTIFDGRYGSNRARLTIWKTVREISDGLPFVAWGPSKLFGIGPNQFRKYCNLVNPGLDELEKNHTHNIFIQAATEYGLLGFIGFAVLLAGLFAGAYQLKKKLVFRDDRDYAALAISWLLILVISGMVDYSFHFKSLMYPIMSLLGLLVALAKSRERAGAMFLNSANIRSDSIG